MGMADVGPKEGQSEGTFKPGDAMTPERVRLIVETADRASTVNLDGRSIVSIDPDDPEGEREIPSRLIILDEKTYQEFRRAVVEQQRTLHGLLHLFGVLMATRGRDLLRKLSRDTVRGYHKPSREDQEHILELAEVLGWTG